VAVDFVFLSRLLRRSVFQTGRHHAKLTFARILALLIFLPLLMTLFMFNWAGLLLDELLFPKFKKVDVKRPVFILGVPRSGTTHLQRVLAKDKANFAPIKTWEIVFAPSVTQRKVFTLLAELDRRVFFGLQRRWLGVVDRFIFHRADDFHRISLFEGEEDELLLLWIFSTLFLIVPFPFTDDFWNYIYFDQRMPGPDKKRIMGYYKKCIQRHLYFHGTDKFFLSKNPMFSVKIRSILETFPDARIINTVRNPLHIVPSVFSLFDFLMGAFGSKFTELRNFDKDMLEIMEQYFLHPIDIGDTLTAENWLYVKFDDLIRDLGKSIRDIYGPFGLALTEDFAAVLEDEVAKAKKYKSAHVYSLEKYNLSRERIVADFARVFEKFGFGLGEGPRSNHVMRGSEIEARAAADKDNRVAGLDRAPAEAFMEADDQP
jgi:omega-hydroxy-beta-dihydromenaquinone-9 sulfotransferase